VLWRTAFAETIPQLPGDGRRTQQERGRQSPRGFATATAPAFVSTPSAVLRNFAEAFLQVRFPNHGGLTPAAPVHLRLCIVKVAIAPANVRAAMPGVGDVSPPWFRYRDCSGVRQHTVSSLPQLCGSVLANAPAEPRRAHARCSWLAHGDRVRTCAELSSHERFPHHGGLTPAAPVHLRLCIVKIAIAPANVRAAMPGVGGVSPPWFRYRDCTGVGQHTVGSLAQLCGSVLVSTLPESRRTDARRS